MDDRDRQTISAIERALAEERRALLTGNVGALKQIQTHKERLYRSLPAAAHPEALVALKPAVERNQVLLVAASGGIRSVIERLQTIRRGGAGLSTYSADGEREMHGEPDRRLERRA